LKISVLFASFDSLKGNFEVGAENGKSYIDWVAYSGKEKLFDFRKMNEAALAFAISLGTTNYPAADISAAKVRRTENLLHLSWDDMSMNVLLRPGNKVEYLKWK
jgi:hypothetical protein